MQNQERNYITSKIVNKYEENVHWPTPVFKNTDDGRGTEKPRREYKELDKLPNNP